MGAQVSKVGRRGTVVIPAKLRRRYCMDEGSTVTVEARADGVLLRPAATVPVEVYSPERKAEFLLANAVDDASYRAAVAEVRAMGLDPDSIAHPEPDQD